MSRAQRAWNVLRETISQHQTWQQVRGLMSAVWVSLLRIGWTMITAHTLYSETGATYSMLATSPHDIKLAGTEGI